MSVGTYRRVLAQPGVASLSAVALLARIPVVGAGVVLTLHVVLTLRHGYAAAGLLAAAATVSAAAGAPLLGRLVDRHGLRPVLALSTGCEGLFWVSAPWLPYPALLAAALVAGLGALPVFSVVRQSLAALVPQQQRRAAYALDSMSVELSYMAGPPVGVLIATQVSTGAALLAEGGAMTLAGAAFYLLDPLVRATDGQGTVPPRRSWLTPRLVAVLVASAASTLAVYGAEVAVVATLQRAGEVAATGLVFLAWGLASLVGGFVFGAVRRGVPAVPLAALLGLATVPIGIAGHWPALCLAILPAGLACAPSIAAAADAVSRLAPERVRGEAMGLHGSALTVGAALGAPLAGAVVDASGPARGFVVAGLAAVLLALLAAAVQCRVARRPVPVAGAVG